MLCGHKLSLNTYLLFVGVIRVILTDTPLSLANEPCLKDNTIAIREETGANLNSL